MKTSLVSSSPQIIRQMIFNINHLSHIFDSLSNPLIIPVSTTSVIGPEIWNSIGQILILWRWALTFYSIKVKLIFIWGTADASFINNALINLLFFMSCHRRSLSILFRNDLRRISELIKFPRTVDIHWLRLCTRLCGSWMYLGVITSSLRSPFDLILNLLSLLLVRVPDLDALADLLVMWSVQRMHLLVLWSLFGWIFMCSILVLIYYWISYWSITHFSWIGSLISISLRRRFLFSSSSWLIWLLQLHLLFDLLFM